MRISQINNLTFQKLPMKTSRSGNIKIIDNLEFPTNVDTFTLQPDDYCTFFDIRIENGKTSYPASHEEILISKDNIYLSEMFTAFETRKLGMGKTLHLINVIEMLENDIPYIHLDATAEAVPYHAKFGFKSDEKWFNGLKGALDFISEADSEFKDEISALKKIWFKTREKEIAGNAIVDKYLAKVVKKYSSDEQKRLLDFYIHMKLTKKDVLANKEFYNKLFKEHHLDYTID